MRSTKNDPIVANSLTGKILACVTALRSGHCYVAGTATYFGRERLRDPQYTRRIMAVAAGVSRSKSRWPPECRRHDQGLHGGTALRPEWASMDAACGSRDAGRVGRSSVAYPVYDRNARMNVLIQ